MKGFFFRVKGATNESEVPTQDTFHVTLGELRDAMGRPRDSRTDQFSLSVEYEADDCDDRKRRRRRWF